MGCAFCKINLYNIKVAYSINSSFCKNYKKLILGVWYRKAKFKPEISVFEKYTILVRYSLKIFVTYHYNI